MPIAEESSNIKIFDNGIFVNYFSTAASMKNFNAGIKGLEQKITVYHNSSLHYYNIPVEIPISTDDFFLQEISGNDEINITSDSVYNLEISDGKARWIIPQLSERTYELNSEDIENVHGKVEVGKPVEWTLKLNNYVVNYETPAPTKTEIETGGSEKIIRIDNSLNGTHYYNVSVEIPIPEIDEL